MWRFGHQMVRPNKTIFHPCKSSRCKDNVWKFDSYLGALLNGLLWQYAVYHNVFFVMTRTVLWGITKSLVCIPSNESIYEFLLRFHATEKSCQLWLSILWLQQSLQICSGQRDYCSSTRKQHTRLSNESWRGRRMWRSCLSLSSMLRVAVCCSVTLKECWTFSRSGPPVSFTNELGELSDPGSFW